MFKTLRACSTVRSIDSTEFSVKALIQPKIERERVKESEYIYRNE